jgi:hypothetical protein
MDHLQAEAVAAADVYSEVKELVSKNHHHHHHHHHGDIDEPSSTVFYSPSRNDQQQQLLHKGGRGNKKIGLETPGRPGLKGEEAEGPVVAGTSSGHHPTSLFLAPIFSSSLEPTNLCSRNVSKHASLHLCQEFVWSSRLLLLFSGVHEVFVFGWVVFLLQVVLLSDRRRRQADGHQCTMHCIW